MTKSIPEFSFCPAERISEATNRNIEEASHSSLAHHLLSVIVSLCVRVNTKVFIKLHSIEISSNPVRHENSKPVNQKGAFHLHATWNFRKFC